MWLYEKIESAKEFGLGKDFPQFIQDNLNPDFELRPYQKAAFSNFITYFENENLRKSAQSVHTLFHMATGSGKTLIMAGLMLYLFTKGFRNFLFFVNLSQIVKKTEDNFLNAASSKYLFAPKIVINGKEIHVRKVSNFSDCNADDINILFDTTAGLHSDLFTVKENAPSLDDFLQGKTVLIADEAHHLNADTKKEAELSKDELEEKHSWESTIAKIYGANAQNVMLEFTATCDIANPEIAKKYQDKIIFNYPLSSFKNDRFSKDIYSVRSDFEQDDSGRFLRCLEALLLSQWRQKIFNDNKILAKPVVLFKSKTIKESQKFKEYFYERLQTLSEKDIFSIKKASGTSKVLSKMFSYFEEKSLTDDILCDELKLAFSREVSIDVNDNSEAEKNQLLVNSLEDAANPYRLIFEVEKLDEGWDCLNLFDIVRLYETRDSKGDKPGKSTVREAQLIGRGARYFPFSVPDAAGIEQAGLSKYMRKFDYDEENPLRVCEQLFYHCQNNSKYITELNYALKAIGLDNDEKVLRHNDLKKEFLEDELYLNGVVFLNRQENKTYQSVLDISEIQNVYTYSFASGSVLETAMLDDVSYAEHYELSVEETQAKPVTVLKSISQIISEFGYNTVYFNASKQKFFSFENIRRLFPECKSMKEFFTSPQFLGDIKVSLTFYGESFSFEELNIALHSIFAKIASELQVQKTSAKGSVQFYPTPLSKIFSKKGTDRFYTKPHGDGEGVSQKDCSPDLQLDLENLDWYVYKNNYGTTEEKKFVKHFNQTYYPLLSQKYSKIRLIRNECQASLYAFNDGSRFEPDFLLFLKNARTDEYEYTQVFIEPKGSQLLLKDEWKEKFLLDLKKNAKPVVQFKSDEKYDIWGVHFFCTPERDADILQDIEKLCK